MYMNKKYLDPVNLEKAPPSLLCELLPVIYTIRYRSCVRTYREPDGTPIYTRCVRLNSPEFSSRAISISVTAGVLYRSRHLCGNGRGRGWYSCDVEVERIDGWIEVINRRLSTPERGLPAQVKRYAQYDAAPCPADLPPCEFCGQID